MGPEATRAGASLVVAAWMFLLPSAAAFGAGDPLPRPSLDGMEAAVVEQLTARRQALDELLARHPEAPAGERAEALGVMGQLYLFHELSTPAQACLEAAEGLVPDDPRWPYYLGYLGQTRGDFPAAAAAFRRLLARRPDDGPALLRLGQVELARGELGAAREALEGALAHEPLRAAAHFELAGLAQARGDLAAAAAHFEAALALAPEATRVYRPLAVVYRRLGRMDAARAALARQGPVPVPFPDPRIETLAGLSAGASVHLIHASLAMEQGRTPEALAEYREAVARAPDNAEAWQGLGEALARSGDPAGAIAACRRSLELDPSHAPAHYDLGTLLLAGGDLPGATAAFEAALALSPAFPRAWANLAAAHARAGRFEEAAQALGHLLDLTPEDREARRRRALALARSGHPGEAAEELERLLAGDPGDLPARLLLGEMLLAAGRFGAAGEAFGAVPAQVPEAGAARLGLARARVGEERWKEAREALETGVRAFPGDGNLVHALARFLATCPEPDLRDGPRALELARRVFAAQASFEHGETLAMALAEVGRFADAAGLEEQLLARLTGEEGKAGAPPEPALKAARERLATYRQGQPWRRVEP